MVLTKSELLTALQNEVRILMHLIDRTQLFLYLKSSGCDELNTRNLWGGVDAPTTA